MLAKGIAVYNGHWIEGEPVYKYIGKAGIYHDKSITSLIDETSLCFYSGKNDSKGVKIFSDDILNIGTVKAEDEKFYIVNGNDKIPLESVTQEMTVQGNLHDELMKKYWQDDEVKIPDSKKFHFGYNWMSAEWEVTKSMGCYYVYDKVEFDTKEEAIEYFKTHGEEFLEITNPLTLACSNFELDRVFMRIEGQERPLVVVVQ